MIKMISRKQSLPSTLIILRTIYDVYYDEFSAYTEGSRQTVNYLPIDISLLAQKLNVHPDIIFGRLYYYLQNRYGYVHENSRVHFFASRLNEEKHVLNFPLASSVLAELGEEERRYSANKWIGIISLIISSGAAVTSLVALLR